MKRLAFLITGLLFTCLLNSHPWKPNHYVIVDTDGGVDDMKAITMLLASPDVRVLAITVSPGALSVEKAYTKVRSLLNSFYHEGIPVGINNDVKFSPKNFPLALNYAWGDEKNIIPESAPDYLKLVKSIITTEKTKIRFVCLAGMSTAYSSLSEIPEFSRQVKDIVWSVSAAGADDSFNYSIDKKASVKMLKQEIPVKLVRNMSDQDEGIYSIQLTGSIQNTRTVYAQKIYGFLTSDESKDHPYSYSGADDLVPVFIHYPELFVNKTAYTVSDCTPANIIGIRESILKILSGETIDRNQVIKVIPADPAFYFNDISSSVSEIINRYGIDEWTSGVIANELHRHLGVFAIIGVKMGIRAREYFNTGVDEFSVVSFAGSTPPLSCMNDGLQVSTGATPGHGLLTVINSERLIPSAEFTYLGHKIKLTLKPEIADKISSELKEINFIHGLDSDIYWEMVRKNSIKYWKELDRHEIFLIETSSP